MISFNQVRFTYASQALPQLVIDQLEIRQGTCVVFCGPSGSGKTCATRLINGLIPDHYPGQLEGEIRIKGMRPGPHSVEDLSEQIASVFQNPASQFFHRQALHELVFACENQGLSPAEIGQRLTMTSQHFQLDQLLDQDLLTASGGQRQRLALASSLMQNPQIVVMDEPTANLDQAGIAMVAAYIAHLKEQGKTVVIAEHRLDFLRDLADHYVYFDQGVKAQEWDRESWLALTDQERHVLGLRGLEGHAQSLANDQTRQGTGLTLAPQALHTPSGRLGYLRELHFPTGQVLGLVGPNGLGKSTLAKVMAGLTESQGQISWNGQILSADQRLAQTSLVMQEVRLQLFADSVVKEINLGQSSSENGQLVIDQLGLTDKLERHPMTLSGGEQQRVLVAHSLLSGKRVLIFDEPTSGLDWRQMSRVASLLKSLASPDKVIIVISHDQELLGQACDQVIDLSQYLEP